jgi:hypothetical protein
MTIKELKDRLDELAEENDGVDEGSNVRVFMPGGDQLDVLALAAYDAAAKEKGEKYVGLRLDTPMSA